jgi:hypothetical protein
MINAINSPEVKDLMQEAASFFLGQEVANAAAQTIHSTFECLGSSNLASVWQSAKKSIYVAAHGITTIPITLAASAWGGLAAFSLMAGRGTTGLMLLAGISASAAIPLITGIVIAKSLGADGTALFSGSLASSALVYMVPAMASPILLPIPILIAGITSALVAGARYK